jgi:hypothetical protein
MLAQQDITIAHVYPWGRSFDEYRRMFALTDDDLRARIIGCADGPASFNAEMASRGRHVVSCDPLYQFSADQIRFRIEQTRSRIVGQARQNEHLFVWSRIRSPDDLSRMRMRAMRSFLADYPAGLVSGRYINESLPRLSFRDDSFDLALCSHFLFLYSDELSLDFHLAAIGEMCRVASEVRVFPLLDMRGQTSSHLKPVLARLGEMGFEAQIRETLYEFQRGGNRMLQIQRRAIS